MTKTKYVGFEKEDGSILKTVKVDAYPVGDVILEGVMFDCTVNENGDLVISPTHDSELYLRNNRISTGEVVQDLYEYITDMDDLISGIDEEGYAEDVRLKAE